MPGKKKYYTTFLKHVLLWVLYFILGSFLASNDGSILFGKGGIFFDKFLVQLVLFPGQALVCYGVIFYSFPGILNKGLTYKNTAITTLLFLGCLFLQYCLIQLARDYLNRNVPNIPAAEQEAQFIVRHTFYYPAVIYFILMADSLVNNWFQKIRHKERLEKENMLAALAMLRAQVHPHFLFNTLNNIYSLTHTQPQKGAVITKKLSGILAYMLAEGEQPLVPLETELKLIEDYISLEKIRYGDRLTLETSFEGDPSHKYIAPLLLIPLVENSFKYGVSGVLNNPWIKLRLTISDLHFLLIISNSRPFTSNLKNENGRLGLNNVKNRLALLYPSQHELLIEENPESFLVSLKIRLTDQPINPDTLKKTS